MSQLPFTPTFFRKIDIYQQLLTFEETESRTSTWDREKIILKWATSSENTAKGERITKNNIKDILDKSLKHYVLIEDAQKVLNSLYTRSFLNNFDYGESGILNSNAQMAGRIIFETKNIKNTKYYHFWISIWWFIFWAGFGLLILEVVLKIKDLIYY